jgi:hypothetical protein
MLPMAMTSAVAQLLAETSPFVSLWRLPLGYEILTPGLCEQLTAKFGVPAIVENKPGAGAIIAIEAVAAGWLHAAHDHIGTVWQNRVLYSSKLPYDLDKHRARGLFPSGPLVVGVPEKIGVHDARAD